MNPQKDGSYPIKNRQVIKGTSNYKIEELMLLITPFQAPHGTGTNWVPILFSFFELRHYSIPITYYTDSGL